MSKNKFKIYADECIDDDFIDHLRNHQINIKKTIDKGRARDDDFQLSYAQKKGCFLLTDNKKHFNNKILSKGGIIIIKKDDWVNSCFGIREICCMRDMEIKSKIFLISKEGIRVKSNKGESLIRWKQDPCSICKEKCSVRKEIYIGD